MINSISLEFTVSEKRNADRIIRTSRTKLGQRDTQARTKDGKPLGYITAEDEECVHVLSSRNKEYRIPKSLVMEFNGSVVLIDMQFGKVGRYKIR
jgi:hypothetical protein